MSIVLSDCFPPRPPAPGGAWRATTGPGGTDRPQGSRARRPGDVAARRNPVPDSLVRHRCYLSQRRPLLKGDSGRQVIQAANRAEWPDRRDNGLTRGCGLCCCAAMSVVVCVAVVVTNVLPLTHGRQAGRRQRYDVTRVLFCDCVWGCTAATAGPIDGPAAALFRTLGRVWAVLVFR